jgi:hypothetical protein
LGLTTNQRSILFGYLLHLLFCVVFSGVFIAEEVDGVGDKGSGDTTRDDVQTFLETFFTKSPEICLFH